MQVFVAVHGTICQFTNPALSVWVGVIDAAAALGVAMLLAGVVDGLAADAELAGA